MLDTITDFCLGIADPALGWLLLLPRDLALAIIAFITSFLLVIVRRITTNQNLLWRLKEDKRRLRERLRDAKKTRDKEAVRRYQATLQQIASQLLFAEGKPLLASILPIAILASWAFLRLGYLPLAPGESFTLRLHTPGGAIGQLAYVLPHEGMTADKGWIKEVLEDKSEESSAADTTGVLEGVATWTLTAEKSETPYKLLIKLPDTSCEMNLLMDGIRYAPPLVLYGDDSAQVLEVVLHEYWPLGFVPGYGVWFPPWILGYLVIVIPLTFALKAVFRIY
jgi:hypothetical protein